MQLKFAAKINLAFGNVLKKRLRWNLYAHKNDTVTERSEFVRTQDDMANLKESLQKTDMVHHCTTDRENNKWKSYKLTKGSNFVSLLEDVPMGCKDTPSPKPFLINHKMIYLTIERNRGQPCNDNFCLFRALAKHLHVFDN